MRTIFPSPSSTLSILTALFLVSAPAMAQDAAEATEPTEEAAPAPAAVDYTINAGSSQLYVIVRKDESTLAASLSHNHVMEAKGWTGSVTWNTADASACQVQFSVPVSSISVDPDNLRTAQGAGFEAPVDAGQREEIKENMLAKDQLDAGSHPNITFKSTSCSGSGSGFTVKGDFTLRGKTKAVSIPMKITADGSSFSASGSFQIKATDHGFEPFSALFGQLKNRNEMTIHVNVKGAPK